MRHAFRVLVWTAGSFAATVAACLLVTLAFGWRPYTVLSGSMEPAIATGDVVVAKPVSPLDVRPGDVVTFPDPTRGGDLVTHRVRRLSVSEGVAHVVTQGDANNAPESWNVALTERVGEVVFRLPKVGHVASWGSSIGGRRLLLAGPAILLGLLLILEVARRPLRPAGEAAGGEGS